VVSQTDVSCAGESAGSVVLQGVGGTTPYTYGIIQQPQGSNATVIDNVISNMKAGDYVVGVTDANGCHATIQVTISEPDEPLAASYEVIHVACFGESTGSATVNPTGGTPPYSYEWSNGSTDRIATGLAAGTYYVVITDAQGCTLEVTDIVVTEPDDPVTAEISQYMNPDCHGSATGSATVTATGGTPPYEYLWSNGDTSATATGLSAGTYFVTVTDANGCSTKVSVLLNDPEPIVASIANKVHVTCFGQNNGQATVVASGGIPPYTYLWDDPLEQTTATAENLEAGQYTVIVTDYNGCQTSVMVEITQPTQLISQITSTQNVSCYGDNDGSASVDVTGGVTPYTYLWNDSENQTGSTATNLEAGTYTVTVTDANGCQTQAIAIIAEPGEPLTSTYTVNHVPCHGEETGSISIHPDGGTAPYTYLWNNGQTGQTASKLEAGIYSVTITDANGCTLEITDIVVEEPIAPLDVMSHVTDVLCYGGYTGAIHLDVYDGTPPYSFLWNNGDTSQHLEDVPAGIYHVEVTDANGCNYYISEEIKQPPKLQMINVFIEDVFCKEDSLGVIDFDVTGGVPPYEYLWSNGETTPKLTNMPGGFYEVNITDANGCNHVFEFEIGYMEEDCELRIPNGISMDDSGFNDIWIINGLQRYPDNKVQVFNRWGTLVYEASPYENDWDGTPNRGRVLTESDGRLPAGTYYYVIQLDPDLNPVSGFIHLAR